MKKMKSALLISTLTNSRITIIMKTTSKPMGNSNALKIKRKVKEESAEVSFHLQTEGPLKM